MPNTLSINNVNTVMKEYVQLFLRGFNRSHPQKHQFKLVHSKISKGIAIKVKASNILRQNTLHFLYCSLIFRIYTIFTSLVQYYRSKIKPVNSLPKILIT